eukprot:UN08374
MALTKLECSIENIMSTKLLRSTKIRLIGHQAPGFLDFHPHPFLMHRTFGCIMQHCGLNDFFARMKNLGSDKVKKDVEIIKSKKWLTKKDVKP